MTTKTTTRTIRLAIATAAVLALMSQAAQAKPIGAIQPSSPVSANSGTYQGTYRGPANVTPLPPDQADRIGTSRAYLGQPVRPATAGPTAVTRTTANGFDWFAATMGAGSMLIVVLIAGVGLAARGRRRVPLSA